METWRFAANTSDFGETAMIESFDLLLASKDKTQKLDSFAKEFFALVGVADFRERESSHYVEGHYFVGAAKGLTFKVMMHSDEDHADLPFWVRVRLDNQEPFSFDLRSFVCSCIIPAGFKAAELIAIGQVEEQRHDF
ncbi:MAG: hypothetical protein QM639_02185 [Rhodocyclaceae bacterium]